MNNIYKRLIWWTFFLKHEKKKNQLQLNNRETSKPTQKWAKDFNRCLTYDGTRLTKSVLLTCLYKSTSEDVVPLHDYEAENLEKRQH